LQERNLNSMIFNPATLGLAVEFWGCATFSLIIAYAYDERTSFALAGYLSVMVAIPAGASAVDYSRRAGQQVMLVLGPAVVAVGLL
jgi:hypothetical protein